MTFNEITVMVVFAFLGYIIVAAIQNWLGEKKGSPRTSDAPSEPAQAPAPLREVPPPLPEVSSPPADTNRRIFAPGMLRDEPAPAESVSAEQPWYEILGVAKNASRDQVVAAYQAKIAEYQPDKVAHMPPDIRALAEKRSAEIYAAYERALLVLGH